MNTQGKTLIASIFAVVLVTAASAQQAPSPPPTMPYGPPIGLEAAKKVMTAAEAGRQDRRGDRRLGRHLGTGWPSRQGGRRRREVSAVRRS
jgi:hypothetical protein